MCNFVDGIQKTCIIIQGYTYFFISQFEASPRKWRQFRPRIPYNPRQSTSGRQVDKAYLLQIPPFTNQHV